jgi:hypothetical protein
MTTTQSEPATQLTKLSDGWVLGNETINGLYNFVYFLHGCSTKRYFLTRGGCKQGQMEEDVMGG